MEGLTRSASVTLMELEVEQIRAEAEVLVAISSRVHGGAGEVPARFGDVYWY